MTGVASRATYAVFWTWVNFMKLPGPLQLLDLIFLSSTFVEKTWNHIQACQFKSGRELIGHIFKILFAWHVLCYIWLLYCMAILHMDAAKIVFSSSGDMLNPTPPMKRPLKFCCTPEFDLLVCCRLTHALLAPPFQTDWKLRALLLSGAVLGPLLLLSYPALLILLDLLN